MTTMITRPRHEGANIRTWIGFKHFMYLVEEAVLQWFRERDTGPARLYHEHGLALSIMDHSIQLPAVLELDDEVTVAVTETGPGRFAVRVSVPRNGVEVGVARAKVRVALVREQDGPPAPVAGIESDPPGGTDLSVTGAVADVLAPPDSGAFLWSWRIPYFYCHYSDRLQHSGYVRALEEAVDRFLTDRGLGVGRMLAERAWIPVVSRARVRLLAHAHMEETLHTRLVVTEVLRGITWEARMDCYVQRGDTLVHTATATILHGYAVSRGERAGTLAELDAATVAALTGREVS